MNHKLILQPTIAFAQLEGALIKLGWVRRPDTSVAPPILPGEPEFASWSRGDESARISYTFNPVVKLRVLSFYGENLSDAASEVTRALPSLGFSDVRQLLQSEDSRTLLLGIFAARELRVFPVLDLLENLRDHAEPAVARAARKSHEYILARAIEIGAGYLREEKLRHPDRSVLFPRLGDAQMRRQTVRWLIRDRRESNEHIEAMLRSALIDDDWEVRASAMIAAVRLKASAIVPDLKRMQLPRTSREGPDETDRSILYASRKLAIAHLAGERVEDGRVDDDRAAMRKHLARCLLGQPVERHDRVFLLINALTEPLEVEGGAPPKFDWIREEEDRYFLERTRIELCWIPGLAHWLGSDDADLKGLNPIHRATPIDGFFIALRPLTISQVRAIRPAAVGANGVPDDEVYLCDHEEALAICGSLGRIEGAPLKLPEADEWEMAVRGTDGRRYPWGNGFEKEARSQSSPWELEQTSGHAGQWTDTTTASGRLIVCAGETDWRCAFRRETLPESSGSRFAVRPTVR